MLLKFDDVVENLGDGTCISGQGSIMCIELFYRFLGLCKDSTMCFVLVSFLEMCIAGRKDVKQMKTQSSPPKWLP